MTLSVGKLFCSTRQERKGEAMLSIVVKLKQMSEQFERFEKLPFKQKQVLAKQAAKELKLLAQVIYSADLGGVEWREELLEDGATMVAPAFDSGKDPTKCLGKKGNLFFFGEPT
jgi:hypothetical protein